MGQGYELPKKKYKKKNKKLSKFCSKPVSPLDLTRTSYQTLS